MRRYFYHLTPGEETENDWQHFSDNHIFHFFWASLDRFPSIVWPQNEFLDYVQRVIGYSWQDDSKPFIPD